MGARTSMEIKEIRALTGLSQRKFSEKYGISTRTLQGWELEGSNGRNCPEYVKDLLEFKVRYDLEHENEEDNKAELC